VKLVADRWYFKDKWSFVAKPLNKYKKSPDLMKKKKKKKKTFTASSINPLLPKSIPKALGTAV
jgi:hypothetical protein